MKSIGQIFYDMYTDERKALGLRPPVDWDVQAPRNREAFDRAAANFLSEHGDHETTYAERIVL